MQKNLQECIATCWECRTTCEKTLYNHCLYEGGEHVAPEHVKLMADCIQICQTAADFMVRQSSLHMSVCAACADICDACAESCDAINSEHMKNAPRFAVVVRRCAVKWDK